MHTTERHLFTVNLLNPEECLLLANRQQGTWLQVLLVAYLRQKLESIDSLSMLGKAENRKISGVISATIRFIHLWSFKFIWILVPNQNMLCVFLKRSEYSTGAADLNLLDQAFKILDDINNITDLCLRLLLREVHVLCIAVKIRVLSHHWDEGVTTHHTEITKTWDGKWCISTPNKWQITWIRMLPSIKNQEYYIYMREEVTYFNLPR